MIDNKKYAKLFFESLGECAFNLDVSVKKEDIERIFSRLGELFTSNHVEEKMAWKSIWYDLLNSGILDGVAGRGESLAASEMKGNNQDEKHTNHNETVSYGVDINLEDKLIVLDNREVDGNGYFTWVMQSNYCGLDWRNKDCSQKEMEKKKETFEKLVKELDENNRIKSLFCYVKENQKRERWILNAIDSEGFYAELNQIDSLKAKLGLGVDKEIYEKYCCWDKWKKNYKYANELIDLYENIKSNMDSFGVFQFYDKAVHVLCNLIPVVYHTKEGTRRLKRYDRWMEERKLVEDIIWRKKSGLQIDEYKKKAYELICEQFERILKKAKEIDYEGMDCVIKLWYLRWLEQKVIPIAMIKINAVVDILQAKEKEEITDEIIEEFLWDRKVNIEV